MLSSFVSFIISTLLLLAVMILAVIANKKPQYSKTIIKVMIILVVITIIKFVLGLMGLF